jgi:hypothetical protein
MRIRTTSKKLKQGINQMLTLLLLVFFVTGSFPVELIHSFAHDHQTIVSHSDDQEKDPCHRLLFHNDAKEGCDHNSHLIVSDNCQMCDLAYHGDQTNLSNVAFAPAEFASEQFHFYKISLESYWAVISSSRAPPSLI